MPNPAIIQQWVLDNQPFLRALLVGEKQAEKTTQRVVGFSARTDRAFRRAANEATKSYKRMRREQRRTATGQRALTNTIRGTIAALGGFFLARRAFREAIGGAAKLETELAKIATLGGGQEGFLGEFKQGILEIGKTSGEEFQTLARTLFDINSAGTAAGESLQVLAANSQLAVAGATDAQIAFRATDAILKAFQLDSDKAALVADRLFATMQRGKTTFEELAPTIGQVAPSAATAGLSVAEMGAALAALTLTTGSATKASTQLEALLTAIARNTSETEKQFGAASLRAKGFTQFMLDLGGATQLQQENLFGLLGRQEAVNGAINLSINGLETYNDILGTTSGAIGLVDENSRRMADTFERTSSRAKRTLQATLISIGDKLLPGLGKGFEDLASEIATFVDDNDSDMSRFVTNLVDGISEVGAALGPILLESLKLIDPILRAIGIRAAFAAAKFAALGLAFAGAAELGLRAAQGLGDLAESFGLDVPGQDRVDKFVETVEDIRRKLTSVAFEAVNAPLNIAGLGLDDKSKAAARAMLGIAKDAKDGFQESANAAEDLADSQKRVNEELRKGAQVFDDASLGAQTYTNEFRDLVGGLESEIRVLQRVTEEGRARQSVLEETIALQEQLAELLQATSDKTTTGRNPAFDLVDALEKLRLAEIDLAGAREAGGAVSDLIEGTIASATARGLIVGIDSEKVKQQFLIRFTEIFIRAFEEAILGSSLEQLFTDVFAAITGKGAGRDEADDLAKDALGKSKELGLSLAADAMAIAAADHIVAAGALQAAAVALGASSASDTGAQIIETAAGIAASTQGAQHGARFNRPSLIRVAERKAEIVTDAQEFQADQQELRRLRHLVGRGGGGGSTIVEVRSAQLVDDGFRSSTQLQRNVNRLGSEVYSLDQDRRRRGARR